MTQHQQSLPSPEFGPSYLAMWRRIDRDPPRGNQRSVQLKKPILILLIIIMFKHRASKSIKWYRCAGKYAASDVKDLQDHKYLVAITIKAIPPSINVMMIIRIIIVIITRMIILVVVIIFVVIRMLGRTRTQLIWLSFSTLPKPNKSPSQSMSRSCFYICHHYHYNGPWRVETTCWSSNPGV